MLQSTVLLGRDNPVIFTFSFSGDFTALGLNTFTRVVLTIFNAPANEVYSTDITPNQLFIVGGNELRLKIGDTTSLTKGAYDFEIIGYSATYNDGYELHGLKRRIAALGKLVVI